MKGGRAVRPLAPLTAPACGAPITQMPSVQRFRGRGLWSNDRFARIAGALPPLYPIAMSRPVKSLVALVLVLSLFGLQNYIRLAAAKKALQTVGPSEYALAVQYGYNARCHSVVAVGFWQRGPKIPERQGYVCGGFVTGAEILVVPHNEGRAIDLDT